MKNRLSLAHDALRVNDDLINCNQAITQLRCLSFCFSKNLLLSNTGTYHKRDSSINKLE